MHFTNAKTILSSNNVMNVYRGCMHGCIYCDSRSACYGMKHDFTDIQVKQNAPQLLKETLKRKRKKCMIITGAMCDPYMPVEKNLCLTKECLQIINNYNFGISVLTKSDLIMRDLELLTEINNKAKCVAQMTITTHNDNLCKIIEPNAPLTSIRYKTLKKIGEYNIPTIAWISPILPYINDTQENIKGLLDYCADAKVHGIVCYNIGLTLRAGNREYFYSKLDEYFPGLKEKYIREFGESYEVISSHNLSLMNMIYEFCNKYNIEYNIKKLFNFMSSYQNNIDAKQLRLF